MVEGNLCPVGGTHIKRTLVFVVPFLRVIKSVLELVPLKGKTYFKPSLQNRVLVALKRSF